MLFILNTQVKTAVVDTMGLLLVIVVTAASVQDRDGARLLFKQLRGGCKKLRMASARIKSGSASPYFPWL